MFRLNEKLDSREVPNLARVRSVKRGCCMRSSEANALNRYKPKEMTSNSWPVENRSRPTSFIL